MVVTAGTAAAQAPPAQNRPSARRASASNDATLADRIQAGDRKAALDLIAGNHFSRHEPGVFAPLLDSLLGSDYYLHLADLASYSDAHARLGALYGDQEDWSRKAILNIAASGGFSSDRSIAEYATEIWHAQACRVG